MQMQNKKGDTLFFKTPPSVLGYAAVGGKKESEGPLADGFDVLDTDTTFGEKTWEQSESRMQAICAETALKKSGVTPKELDYLFAGDLENQCTASNYTMRDLPVPFLGLYNACATMAEGLGLAASFIAGGLAERTMALASSHFCAAERQYRFPLEYGGKRTPTSQWTATASGGVVLGSVGGPPYVKSVIFGRVIDYGIKDINNMGAAMAPAAAHTLLTFLKDSGRRPEDFDRIFTGDLGAVGSTLLEEICKKEGVKLTNHSDCGLLLYDREKQQVDAGGSGVGCSASVLCSHILPQLKSGKLREVLFIATGALMSPTTFMQKESIPGIAHLVQLGSGK